MASAGTGTNPTAAGPSFLSPLQSPVFRVVWLASLASNFGGLIQSVGASWMMTHIGTTEMVALVQASVSLPIMLLSLPAGALADNVDRRVLMLVAQGFMLAVSVALSIAAWLGLMTPWVLLLFTFLIGCGAALNGPAWQASVSDMVPRRDLAGAVALNSMGYNLARSVGPAIGGLIVAAAGAAAAFTVNAFSYLGLIYVLARWRPERTARTLPREGLRVAMIAGLRYAAMSGRIGSVLLRAMLFGFAASAVQALMPLLARDAVGGGPFTFGLLLGAFGAGAVGGAVASQRLRGWLSNEMIVRWSCLAFGVATVILAYSPWLAVNMLALAVTGGGWVLTLSTLNVTVQMSAPRWVAARALALYQVAAFGGMALGSWIWGVIAGAEGLSVALVIAGAVQVACVAIGLRVPLPSTAGLNLDLVNRWTEPDLAVAIQPRSGPIVVTIEYIIDERDIDEFLAAMADRRRIRRRDGARHWTLMRDLADPRLWIERYHTPTWVDYVRHNQRMTQADIAVTDHVRALHRGAERPKVHRMIERPTRPAPAHGLHPQEMPEPLTDPTRAS
ncbi:putative MFS family arabinose efflux permease [Stella humosa]|uniref:Putative MFS family arabinose efflux permease n=1 Tax=Stella humosa TaxID=94 RepID=A0A3N1L0U6_9PROT|nr:MFS transporter [Stella humosa]ROP83135.1 putative MFS family arabinose efflux permease [Stella humosa]BBK30088.1 MFS transporter [Stella humosa]